MTLILLMVMLLIPMATEVSYGREDDLVPIDEVVLEEEISLFLEEKIKINYKIKPENATDTLEFTVQNSNIAKIEAGYIIGISPGETILLTKAAGGNVLKETKVIVKNRGGLNENSNKPLAGRIIYVDPGHGGSDPGAVAHGFREVDLNDQLSSRIARHLREAGATVLFTRQPFQNITISNPARIEMVNNSNADILISVHHDGHVNRDVRGATTFFSTYRPAITTEYTRILFRGRLYTYVGEAPGGFLVEDNGQVIHVAFRDGAQSRTSKVVIEAQKSMALARLVQNALASTGLQNRGFRDSDLYMTRWAKMPAIILEAGFVTNIHDVTQAARPEVQERRAIAITNAVIEYFQNFHTGGIPSRNISAPTVAPTSITLSKAALQLNVGDRETLVASISPHNATNKKVEWSSSNKNIVSVDTHGNVRAIGPGKATITARTAVGGRVATINVSVIAPVTGVSIKGYNKISLANIQKLTAIVSPSNASNKKVIWISSNPEVATVDSTGMITGIKEGEAIITVKAEDGGVTATHIVTVARDVELDNVEIVDRDIEIVLGQSAHPELIFTPSNATNKGMIWESEDTSIIRVLGDGSFRSVSVGEVVLNGVSVDGGHKVKVNVTVLPIPEEQLIDTSFRLSNISLYIDIPKTIYFRNDSIVLHDDIINIIISRNLIDSTLQQLNIIDYENMVIKVNKLEANMPEHFNVLSQVYQFSMLVDDLSIGSFPENIEKQFKFDPTLINNMEKLSLYWYNEDTEEWEKIDSIVDLSNNLVIAHVNHWSKFILLEDTSVSKHYYKIFLGIGGIIVILLGLVIYSRIGKSKTR